MMVDENGNKQRQAPLCFMSYITELKRGLLHSEENCCWLLYVYTLVIHIPCLTRMLIVSCWLCVRKVHLFNFSFSDLNEMNECFEL